MEEQLIIFFIAVSFTTVNGVTYTLWLLQFSSVLPLVVVLLSLSNLFVILALSAKTPNCIWSVICLICVPDWWSKRLWNAEIKRSTSSESGSVPDTEAYASGLGEGKMRGCLSAHLFDFSSCSRSARLPRILGSFALHSHVCNTLQPCYKVHVGRDSEVEEGTHPSVRVSAAERLQILVGSVVGDWAGDNVLKHMWAKTYFYSL